MSNSTVQYNYSHDNDGPGLLLYTGQNNSSTRREHCSLQHQRERQPQGRPRWHPARRPYLRRRDLSEHGLHKPLGSRHAETFESPLGGLRDHCSKNILFASGPLPTLTSPVLVVGTLLLQGNDYYGDSGLKIRWGSRTFTNLPAWRTATGEEKLLGEPTGLEVDPKLVSPGGGGTIGDPDQLAHFTAYKLQNGSPMIDDALNLATLFGIDPGGRDFYGVTLFEGLGPDIGASES